MRTIENEVIINFGEQLLQIERARATAEKYVRDVRAFADWLGDQELCREAVVEYKATLCEKYASATVNGALSSLNRFFDFIGRQDLRVKALKMPKKIFDDDKQLTKTEYSRLIAAAGERLSLIMQTICSTGIRVSELRFITVDAVNGGIAEVNCKGRRRMVLLPKRLCKMLKGYIGRRKIKSGPVFVSKNGSPLDRSNIWSEMKKLCKKAGVSEKKVFPHNLRHLFARTFYEKHKDIVRLADILGHSSINTTRIYTIDTIETCRRYVQALDLLRC